MLRFIIVFCALFLSSAAVAYELNGTMTPQGGGSYSVVLKNSYGHVFTGTAEDQGDGELDITVQDSEGTTFSGYALDNDNGGYTLDLDNDDTGDIATGTIDEN